MNITSQKDRFSKLVVSTLNDSAAMAASAPAGAKKFATKKENFTALNSLYTLAQCTPDLSVQDCSGCLQLVVDRLKNCCSVDQGARVFTPSCNARFEIYPFYGENLSLSPASAPVFPPSPQPPSSARQSRGKKNRTTVIVAIVAPISVSVLLFVIGYCLLVRRSRKKQSTAGPEDAGTEITTVESLQFDLGTIEAATNKFSEVNKLGEGGFGEVYKGTLPNGQEIAVKRLSRSSSQGAEEFKNEVLVVAKLQHRNLVRLLGFCLEAEEKILVYEFVPNKSLDYFLYDSEKQRELDWSRRYKIISGIGRGIVYLHEESRLKIIHRDLKASNVLLDADMNPKISDFGMARIFGVDQTQANTSRVVGTYGYMSPEYAMHGQFSVKSDMYSFGVLVLEIISGKKNSSFYEKDGTGDLLSYAWKVWRDGRPLELLDPMVGDCYSKNEVIRCIHIGLLCVQEDPADRPTMATILLMLNSYSVSLPSPGQPAFFVPSGMDSNGGMKMMYSDQSATKSSPSHQYSINEASITELLPR